MHDGLDNVWWENGAEQAAYQVIRDTGLPFQGILERQEQHNEGRIRPMDRDIAFGTRGQTGETEPAPLVTADYSSPAYTHDASTFFGRQDVRNVMLGYANTPDV